MASDLGVEVDGGAAWVLGLDLGAVQAGEGAGVVVEPEPAELGGGDVAVGLDARQGAELRRWEGDGGGVGAEGMTKQDSEG